MKTLIRNGTVIAWVEGAHRVLQSGDVVFEEDRIVYVGPRYEGDANAVVDATDRLVFPGFVNTHLHVTDTYFTKGYMEDINRRTYNGLYKILPAVRHAIDPDAQVIAAECAFAELVRTGSTTVVELGYDFEVQGEGNISICERIAEVAARVGLRCYMGPRYRAGYYGDDGAGSVFYRDYPNRGRDRFEACVEFCRSWNGRYDDRIRAMLAPGQVDTCDPDLLKETRKAANGLQVPIQLHAGQSPNEFRKIRDRHGKSTIRYLMDTDLLGSDMVIGHGMFLSENGDVDSIPKDEIHALRDSGTSIAHLPWIRARAGEMPDSLKKYLDAGVNVSLGTDTYPFDMVNEMRFASVCCKAVDASPAAGDPPDVFRVATVGGATALGRPDLGRLAAGCKADIVLMRLDTLRASPAYDPFRFLVLGASGDDIDTVYVDGNLVVSDGEVLTVDVPRAVGQLKEANKRVKSRIDL